MANWVWHGVSMEADLLWTKALIFVDRQEFEKMLVLSRKEGERIKLGDSIVITMVRVSGETVRIGIEAPADVIVLREELEKFECPAQSRPIAA